MGVTDLNYRDPFWDTLKAVLIVLVVLGHTGTALGDHWQNPIIAIIMTVSTVYVIYAVRNVKVLKYLK